MSTRRLEAVLAVLNDRRLRLLARLLLVAAIVFALVEVRSYWAKSGVDLGQIDWWTLAAAAVFAALGIAASGFIWLRILRGLGLVPRLRWAAVFFQTQIAKYIPGGIWQYAGRAEVGREQGIPVRPVAISLPLELAGTLAAAAAVSLLLLGRWGAVGCVLLVASVAAVVPRVLRSRGAAIWAGSVPRYAIAWVAIGVGFWLTARALLGVPASDLLVYAGAFAAAWAVGLVAIYAPGGIGVREAMLVAILHGRLPPSDALVVAAASRALMTLVDIAAAAVGTIVLRSAPSPTREPSTPPAGGAG